MAAFAQQLRREVGRGGPVGAMLLPPGRSGPRLRLKAGDPVPPVSAAVTLTAGCDKSFAACRDKFANPDNFRGFPHLPGNDAAYAYVTEGRDFDGEPLVP